MKYSIQQFRKEYANEDMCLDKVFTLRYNNIKECPCCKEQTTFRRVPTRRCYQCVKCYHQVFPCAGTIFEKSRTPLLYWFYAMFLFTASKNGLSASELERQLGVTYKTAFRMLRQIRTLIQTDSEMLSNVIQTDETFVGGKNKNRHKDKKFAKCQGRSFKDKTPVMGILSDDGKIRCFVIPNTEKDTLQPILKQNILKGSVLVSDEWKGYNGLENYFEHFRVNHKAKQYVNDYGATTNGVENFWSILKRTLHGSYVSVSPKYLQLYVNEVVFRFNARLSDKPTFEVLLNYVSA